MQQDRNRPSFPRRSPVQRPSTPGVIRPTYAGVFDLEPGGYDHARDVVLNWIRNHRRVRDVLGSLTDIDFDHNLMAQDGLLAQSAQSADGSTAVVRLQHREWNDAARAYDPARNWRTDITVGRDGDGAWIATRQWFAGVASDFRPCLPPRFIKDLWAERALSDSFVLENGCWYIEYDEEVDQIVELIMDEDRALPVVLMADGCPLDQERVAADSIGLAHVCKLPRKMRMRLNEALASENALAHGAVRTFYPRLPGRPILAPAAKWETIIEWRFGDESGPAAFGPWLHGEMGRAVVARLLNDPAHETFEKVRGALIQTERAELETHTEDPPSLLKAIALLENEQKLLLIDIEDVKRQLAEATSRAQEFLDQKADAEQGLRDEIKRNERLQYEKKVLQDALNAKADAEPIAWDSAAVERLIDEQPAPDNIFDAVEQARRLFDLHGMRVNISAEAEEGAMEALSFKRPADVQAALIRLGFLWNDARRSGKRLDSAARDCTHYPCTMFESETTMRLYESQRRVRVDGTTVVLQKHVKLGGGGVDESARIYFGDKDGQILIGHVGRHLDVAKTQ